MTIQQSIDEAKLQAFLGQVVTDTELEAGWHGGIRHLNYIQRPIASSGQVMLQTSYGAGFPPSMGYRSACRRERK